ncbi:MAG: Gfo/Idh/MocA family oxidoreductase [Verrucomicrobia bacterium]|nr:Gfo/Idh/MocA family oxidoreductase [Verrucomicrobiota bacterium]MDA1068637.1 Gfo/Idh/MocA family oxidoreductase [Verrucomicrobiota bacterium]
MNKKTTVSRRKFLAASATAVAFPTIIPASALGAGKKPAPSNRINVACLGFGTIAYTTVPNFLNNDGVQVVAMADPNRYSGNYGYQGEKVGGRLAGMQMVNEHYAKDTGRLHYNGCRSYEDFRELLDNEDVDAVNISTPDHWHAVMAIYCANKKKHVYGQKPLAVTVAEGRAMAQAVARNKITWQTGSQQRSESQFREAVEFVRNGRIGNLKKITIKIPGGHSDWNQMGDRKKPESVPEGLNYDLWEGPAPHREYRPATLPLNWRHNYDYSGGMITDWGAHHVDIAQWAMGMDGSGPIQIDIKSSELPANDDLYNTATKFSFTCTYASGVQMVVQDKGEDSDGITFEGDNGKSIFVKRGSITMDPYDLRREQIKDDEERVYKSTDHVGNFVDCIKSGKQTVAPIEAAHRTISICHLANIAIRLGRKTLKWDPKRERILEDAEASKYLSRPIRGNWKLR